MWQRRVQAVVTNARNAYPEHFFLAVEHGFALLAQGFPLNVIHTLSRGAVRKGLEDAAAGYDHVILIGMCCE